jgi:hypothetical protein
MATGGWQHVTMTDLQQRQRTTPSKYRNVRVRIGTEWFDSQREADYWRGLQARAVNGEITGLRRQVVFPLLCPAMEDRAVMVSSYVADFVYVENGVRHVVDAKGYRTRLYLLKRKWLQLQDGIVVEEV